MTGNRTERICVTEGEKEALEAVGRKMYGDHFEDIANAVVLNKLIEIFRAEQEYK